MGKVLQSFSEDGLEATNLAAAVLFAEVSLISSDV